MPVSDSVDSWLGSTKQRLRSPVGTGYYLAYRLPDPEEDYYFGIESFAVEVAGVRQIAIPVVLVLRADFSVSRSSGMNALDYTPEDKIRIVPVREQLTVYVKVNRKLNPQERYIVITTPESTLGEVVTFSRVSGGGVTVVPIGSKFAVAPVPVLRQSSQLVSSPEGEIRVTNQSSLMSRPFDRFIRF